MMITAATMHGTVGVGLWMPTATRARPSTYSANWCSQNGRFPDPASLFSPIVLTLPRTNALRPGCEAPGRSTRKLRFRVNQFRRPEPSPQTSLGKVGGEAAEGVDGGAAPIGDYIIPMPGMPPMPPPPPGMGE